MTGRTERVAVHLLRHAHAGDSSTWEGPDELRPLTKRGRRQAERLGRFLAATAVRPGAIVSSPRVRALQTAEIVAEALHMSVAVDARLGEGYDLEELERIVLDAGIAGPMLVGHDPDMSLALAGLCGGRGLAMRKGALATLDVDRPFRAAGGMLRWMVPPELLLES